MFLKLCEEWELFKYFIFEEQYFFMRILSELTKFNFNYIYMLCCTILEIPSVLHSLQRENNCAIYNIFVFHQMLL